MYVYIYIADKFANPIQNRSGLHSNHNNLCMCIVRSIFSDVHLDTLLYSVSVTVYIRPINGWIQLNSNNIRHFSNTMEIAYIQLASIFLILISIGRESSVQTIRVSTRSPETEASRLKMIELLSRVGDGDVEKNRIPNTDQSADDKNELARLKREVSRLESIVQQLQHLCHGTSTDWVSRSSRSRLLFLSILTHQLLASPKWG